MYDPQQLEAIHRSGDVELVGYVGCEDRPSGPAWIARTLFGGELRAFPEREPAVRFGHDWVSVNLELTRQRSST